MLQIVSGKPTDPTRASIATIGTSSYDGLSTRTVVLRSFEKTVQRTRSPYDFLHQGSAFDRFGNTEVSNRQVKADLVGKPTFDGSDGSGRGVTVTAPTRTRIFSEPPALKYSGKWYSLLNLGALDVAYAYVYKYMLHVYRVRSTVVGSYQSEQRVVITSHIGYNKNSRKVEQRGLTVTISGTKAPKVNVSAGVGLIPTSLQRYTTADEVIDAAALLADSISFAETLAATAWLSYIASEGVPAPTSSFPCANWNSHAPSPEFVSGAVKASVAIAARDPFPDNEASLQAREAIENLNDFSSNLLAYASDLKKTGDTVREVLHLAENWRSPKAWASAWLSGRYGDRLAVNDTIELLEAVKRAVTQRALYAKGQARRRLSTTVVNGGTTYTYVQDRLVVIIAANSSYDGLMTAIDTLMRWDAWPSLENTWDMIPLSFLVDWVLPVSDLLGQIDAAIQAPYIRAHSQYVGMANESTTTLSPNLSVQGTITVRYYTRRPHNVLGDVRPYDVVAEPPSFSVVHLADALALLYTAGA